MIKIKLSITEHPDRVGVELDLFGENSVSDRETDYTVQVSAHILDRLKALESSTQKPVVLEGNKQAWMSASKVPNYPRI